MSEALDNTQNSGTKESEWDKLRPKPDQSDFAESGFGIEFTSDRTRRDFEKSQQGYDEKYAKEPIHHVDEDHFGIDYQQMNLDLIDTETELGSLQYLQAENRNKYSRDVNWDEVKAGKGMEFDNLTVGVGEHAAFRRLSPEERKAHYEKVLADDKYRDEMLTGALETQKSGKDARTFMREQIGAIVAGKKSLEELTPAEKHQLEILQGLSGKVSDRLNERWMGLMLL